MIIYVLIVFHYYTKVSDYDIIYYCSFIYNPGRTLEVIRFSSVGSCLHILIDRLKN